MRGEEFIRTELTRIIETVQWVHDKTIAGMNAGTDLRTLTREIKTPPELTLTEEYGKLSWNVRAIWHEYTGWVDPARGTTEHYGVPPASVAPSCGTTQDTTISPSILCGSPTVCARRTPG